jgi:hypothetical protein
MTKSKVVCQLFMLITLVTGCVKAQKHKENVDGPSSFRLSKTDPVVSVEGYARNQIISQDIELYRSGDVDVISKDANYSSRREYYFKMCGLQDMLTQNPLLGQKFDIYSELDIRAAEGRTATITADGGGNCIYWTATIPFNYFAESVNLEINFIFKAVTGSKSYIHRKVLLNPWDGRRGVNREFTDFTNTGLTDDLKSKVWARGIDEIDMALAGKLVQSEKRLEIGSVNIVPVQKNKENLIETNLIGANVEAEMNEKVANEQLRLKLNNGQKLQTLDLHLNIRLDNLRVRLKDSAGVNRDESLTTGRYRIFAQLIATDTSNKGHFILTDKLIPNTETVWSTNTMGVNAVLPLSLVIRPQWGNLNLALKVVPIDVPGIEAFEGLYHLGQFNELAGGKSPLFDLSEYTLNKDSNTVTFNYDEYIKKSYNFSEWEKGLAEQGFKLCQELTEKEKQNNVDCVTDVEKGYRKFLFSTLNVLFSRVMPGDTATDRTIQYSVETCVINTFTGARVGQGLIFDIETEDRGHTFKIRRQTNDMGCLTWVAMISHKFYHRENLVRKVSKLTYMGKDAAQPTFELDYYINPWDEKFTFGRDSRLLPKEYLQQIEEQQKIAPPTRVLITDFKYDATGFRYVIDKYMNMTVKKTVLMTIKPKILKYNSIVWGRSGLSELRDGIYLFKIAMQKDYLDPAAPGRQIIYNENNGQYRLEYNGENLEKKQFLVVKELLVRVLGGEIVTPIEFDVADLRTLRIRAQMIIQIETIDEMLLRAVALADTKLNKLIQQGESKKTAEIMSLKAQEADINRKLEELNESASANELRQTLQNEKEDVIQKMQELLASLDQESLQKTLDIIDSIAQKGESNVSIDRNIKYQALNQMLRTMRTKVQTAMKAREEEIRRQYAKDQNEECRRVMNQLMIQGRADEAQLFDPSTNSTRSGTPGSLCVKDIPQDQIFFHMTTANDVGSEAWLETLFTKEEYELYQKNQLRDDFTKPYLPNYDFNLLSNQGDELINPDGTPRKAKDQTVSGLSRRTFIGPVTFVLNGNGSAVRPTDVLDENQCNGTCEQLGEVEFDLANQSEQKGEIIKKFGLPVNAAYEDNPYFGYLGHFYGKQVNDLIPMYRSLRFQYHQEMKAFSQVGNFLDQLALNYVTFASVPQPVKSLDYNCYLRWKESNEDTYLKWQSGEDKSFKATEIPESCYRANQRVISKDNFLKASLPPKKSWWKWGQYNYNPPSKAQWKEFSKNGLFAKLSLEEKEDHLHSLCKAMRQNFLDSKNPEDLKKLNKAVKGVTVVSGLGGMAGMVDNTKLYGEKMDQIENNCHGLVHQFIKDVRTAVSENPNLTEKQALALKAKQLPFVIERRVRVYETSNRYIYKKGETLNYSVGAGFALSHGMNVNRGYKFDPIEAVEKGLGLAPGDSKASIASKVIGAFSSLLNFQWGMNESQSTSDGTSVSVGTTLAAQISTLDIEISKWEKCIVVRYDDGFMVNHVLQSVSSQGTVVYDPRFALKGLGTMICSGDQDIYDDLAPKRQPLRVREKYYYLTQIFNEGDMQDPQALSNHPWMIQLRGIRDFAIFEKALKLPPKHLTWANGYELALNDMLSLLEKNRNDERSSLEVVDPEDTQKALNMMQDAFERALPTFPGMYTFSETGNDEVTGWNSDLMRPITAPPSRTPRGPQ